MGHFAKFKKLVEEYSSVADFAVIYIAEAHPTDGWAIPGNVEIADHRSMEDRLTAARMLEELEPVQCPLLVDGTDDAANLAFTAMPERLYILLDQKIVYHGGQGPFKYKISEVEDWLKKWKPSS